TLGCAGSDDAAAAPQVAKPARTDDASMIPSLGLTIHPPSVRAVSLAPSRPPRPPSVNTRTQRAPHHASAAVAQSTTGPGCRKNERGDLVSSAPSPTTTAAKPVDAAAANSPTARASSPSRTEPESRSATPTAKKAMVVKCQVT